MQLDLKHVYLLGWSDRDGHPHLTTWEGSRPLVHVIVTGPVDPYGPPLWDADAAGMKLIYGGKHYERFSLHAIPEGKDPREFAKELNGVYAFGWYIEEGFDRPGKDKK